MSAENNLDFESENETASDAGNVERYLEFALGQECYAIPLLSVREVIAVPNTTPVPYTPAHFIGIMNLRGQVISIVDLRKKLGITAKGDEAETAVIIVDLDPIFVGVIVDSVNTVLALSTKDISPPPEIESSKNTDYITGVYRQGEKISIMMNIGKVLDVADYKAINKGKSAA